MLTRVVVGQEFLVRLRLRATRRDRASQIAVVDLLPGGVEPVIELQPPSGTIHPTPASIRPWHDSEAAAAALPVGVPGQSNWVPDHVDVREDRLVLYGDITRNAGTFVYRVRATNAGTFQTPPAFAEGMYNRTIIGI